jgi:hypothetical protein
VKIVGVTTVKPQAGESRKGVAIELYRRFPNRLYRGFPNPLAVYQSNALTNFHAQPVWKPAVQQTWKSAVRGRAALGHVKIAGVLVKYGGITGGGRRAFQAQHRLAQRLVDVKWLPVKLVTGAQLAVYLVGKVMKATVVVIVIAYHDNIISRNGRRLRRIRLRHRSLHELLTDYRRPAK